MGRIRVVGIDNGYKGAIVELDDQREATIIDMPTVEEQRGKSKRQHYDKHAMAAIVRKYAKVENLPQHCKTESTVEEGDQILVLLEQATPMKGKIGGGAGSAQGNFRTGMGSGIWQGLLIAYQIPYQEVHSKTWQTLFFKGIHGQDTKQKSFNVASQLFPKHAQDFKGPRGGIKDGRTDAILIAEYGLRQLMGQQVSQKQAASVTGESNDD